MKNKILLLTGLLALCIVGQVLLRPCLGSGSTYAQALEKEKTADLLDTKDLQSKDLSGFKTDPLHGKLLQQFAMMLLFVAIIGAGAWFLLKKMPARLGTYRSKHITVTETASLGPRKQLHIVQVGSKRFLIASTVENIRLLSDVTGELGDTEK
jgi:flagellar biogenesis protein FliO